MTTCLVCKSLDCVEDEQHFVFDCPAYSHMHIRSQHLDLLQHCCGIADFMSLCEPNACGGGFIRECFGCRKQVFDFMNSLNYSCCLLGPRTLKYID